MAGRKNIKYAVYFNTHDPHVTTHKITCFHVDIHDTDHNYKQGGWAYLAEKHAAEQFADAISKHVGIESKPCKSCGGL